MIIVAAGCVEAERIGSAAGVDVPADGVLLFFFFSIFDAWKKDRTLIAGIRTRVPNIHKPMALTTVLPSSDIVK